MSLLVPVASSYPFRFALVAGCVVTAAAWLVPPSQAPAAKVSVAIPVVVPPAAEPVAAPVEPVVAAVAPVRSSELMFVFQADGDTYMKLATLEAAKSADGEAPEDGGDHSGVAMPRHGKLRHSHGEDGVDAVTASVALRHVPAAYATWQGQKVKVDNICEATVIGFAVVARVTGDPSYAGEAETWTAASVMANGSRMLAAKLDDCVGTYARTASLPNVVVPTKLVDAKLQQAAIAALIASPASQETQRAWDAQRTDTGRAPNLWHSDGAVTAEVLRHPITGEIFVSAHGRADGGCGDPEANVWGLFRVVDGSLVPVQLRQLGEIRTIDALIDLEGDGDFELLGKPWLGDAELLTRASGDEIDSLSVPFHGCPC
ncbi:MAG: hypothetical protein H7138_11415 [Myxococcales bacterium]|nr:hypothetical protein [Myxococcales bacterium]